jgi:2-polyprenyl-6-methoxyphenol hydroxylase-like FAD-dependent oxidoreductase
MRRVNDVLVVGAGIGGLAVAAAFAARGVRTQVVEVKPDATAGLGVGINQPANALRALDSLGLLDDVLAVGFRYDTEMFYDWQGGFIVECPSRLGGQGIPANSALGRADLARILLAAARKAGAEIRFETTVACLEQEPGTVHVALSDGRSDKYDLVIGFDGINSALRGRLFGAAHDPAYTGFAIWRVPMPRPAEIRCACLFQGPGSRAGVIPLSEDSMYLLAVTQEPGRPRHDPASFHRLLRERLAGYGGLVAELRDAIPGPETIAYTPLDEVRLPPPWYRGRVIVLGDAAHASAPHLTQGAAMALEDAVVLAAEVAGTDAPVEQSLAAFLQRRLPRVGVVQDVSHAIVAGDMAATTETLPAYLTHMKAELPGQLARVQSFLNDPA